MSATSSPIVQTVQARFGPIHVTREGRGPRLILLHTAGASHHQYGRLVPYLTDGFEVIVWDMAGHGESRSARGDLSIAQHAEALSDVLDAMGGAPAHIAGVSIGGHIALRAAVAAPERFISVSVIEAALQSQSEWAARWPMVQQAFGTPIQSYEAVKARLPVLDDAQFARWNLDRERAGSEVMMAAMAAIRDYDFAADLAVIDRPLQLVFGDRSPVGDSLAAARRLAPCAQTVTIENCGHFPMLEQPGVLAERLTSFAHAADASARETEA
jgi:3-oxoadipate enol-lactonase/4-carboxymuconolactone decarboxylase